MNTTLANRLLPATTSTLIRNIVLAVGGSLVVAAAAQVTVPMWPVPMTLQTLAVLVIGGAFGARLGAATLALYAVEGAVGLPFFAGGKSGIADAKLEYFLPAGSMGYVLGFILAAALVGYLAQSGWINSILRMIAAAAFGAFIIYAPGLVWLAIWATATGVVPDGMNAAQAALQWGLYPFILGDTLKAAIAGLGLAGAWARLQK